MSLSVHGFIVLVFGTLLFHSFVFFHSILVISAVISVWQMKIGLEEIMTWATHSSKQG